MPNLMAYDICGVQPMSGPTGLIFAMRAMYDGPQFGPNEALFDEADVQFANKAGGVNETGEYDFILTTVPRMVSSKALQTASVTRFLLLPQVPGCCSLSIRSWSYPSCAEPWSSWLLLLQQLVYTTLTLNNPGGNGLRSYPPEHDGRVCRRVRWKQLGETGKEFRQMGFSIEKAIVEAKGRALKAQYSIELAQDLRAIHGLDAEAELANILSSEILAEINREVVRTVYQNCCSRCSEQRHHTWYLQPRH